jgi:hypothetical protein
VSPVRCELGFYFPEDGIHRSYSFQFFSDMWSLSNRNYVPNAFGGRKVVHHQVKLREELSLKGLSYESIRNVLQFSDTAYQWH